MTDRIADRLGLAKRELIAIVGAGGKSSLLRQLGSELARTASVILTTTTKMGADQVSHPAAWTSEPTEIEAALRVARDARQPLFVASQRIGEKVVGIEAETLDDLFESSISDFIVIEADGARRRAIKAPAPHEPVIPHRTTLVIVVASARAIGHPIDAVAHRPERFAEVAGIGTSNLLTVEHAAAVLVHPSGGRKNVPPHARLCYVITPSVEDPDAAPALAAEIAASKGSPPALVWNR